MLVVFLFSIRLLAPGVHEAFYDLLLGDTFSGVDIGSNLVDVLAMTFAVVNRELEVGDDFEFGMLLHIRADITGRALEEDESIILATIRDRRKNDRILAVIRGDRDTRDRNEGIGVCLIADICRYYLTDEGGGTVVFVVVELFVHNIFLR